MSDQRAGPGSQWAPLSPEEQSRLAQPGKRPDTLTESPKGSLWEEVSKPTAAGTPPGEQTSLWDTLKTQVRGAGVGFGRGVRDVVEGAAQLGGRLAEMGPPEMAVQDMPNRQALGPRVDDIIRQSAAAYEASPARQAAPLSAGIGRFGGNLAATSPLMAMPMGAPTLGGRMALGAAAGAMGAAPQPVVQERDAEPGDYWAQKRQQMMLGAGLGAGVSAAGSALAPPVSAGAQYLMQRGVPLNPGAAMGGPLHSAERTMRTFPFIGALIRGGEERSSDGFNRALVNEVLAPAHRLIGEEARVPRGMNAGHELQHFMERAKNSAYDAALRDTFLREDAQLIAELRNLRGLIDEMPGDMANQFRAMFRNRVEDRLGATPPPPRYPGRTRPSGELEELGLAQASTPVPYNAPLERSIDGRTMQRMLQDIDQFVYKNYQGKRFEAAEAAEELSNIFRRTLLRQNPQARDRIQAANDMFTMFARVREAAARGEEGVVSPLNLLNTVRRQDRSAGKGDFSRGDEPLQAFAEIGRRVLQPRDMPGMTHNDILNRLANFVMGGVASIPYRAAQRTLPGQPFQRAGQAAGRAAGPIAGETARRSTAEEPDEPYVGTAGP